MVQRSDNLTTRSLSADPLRAKSSSSQADRIRAEQIDNLYRGAPFGLILEPTVAALLTISLWISTVGDAKALWLVSIWSIVALRAVLWHRYRNKVTTVSDAGHWALLLMLTAAVSGFLWGLSPLLVPAEAVPLDQAKALFAIAGVAAAGTVAMASYLPAVGVWLGVIGASLLGALIIQGTATYLIAVFILLFGACLAIGARHINNLLSDSLRLKLKLSDAVAAAEAANRSKSDFIANMSHELRTPLNAIIGFSELIKDQIAGPIENERYLEYAADIHQSGVHLLDIVNDILDISKIEAGNLELKEERVALNPLVSSVLNLMQVQAEGAGVTISTSLPDPAPTLWGDARAIKQIFLNLLSNAVKFTPVGGSVTVAITWQSDGGLLMSVRDTGIGIDPANLPKAMETFGQLEAALHRKHAGTGLGLPLVRSLVELHGGKFHLESAVNVGTTAVISWPSERVLG